MNGNVLQAAIRSRGVRRLRWRSSQDRVRTHAVARGACNGWPERARVSRRAVARDCGACVGREEGSAAGNWCGSGSRQASGPSSVAAVSATLSTHLVRLAVVCYFRNSFPADGQDPLRRRRWACSVQQSSVVAAEGTPCADGARSSRAGEQAGKQVRTNARKRPVVLQQHGRSDE